MALAFSPFTPDQAVSFPHYTRKHKETRMRAKDFGTPLEGARSAKNKEYILK